MGFWHDAKIWKKSMIKFQLADVPQTKPVSDLKRTEKFPGHHNRTSQEQMIQLQTQRFLFLNDDAWKKTSLVEEEIMQKFWRTVL